MRNIILEDDEIKNITVYDTSGLYSDPNYSHIYEEGLKKIRGNWLQNRKGIIKSSKTDLKYIELSKSKVKPFPSTPKKILKKEGEEIVLAEEKGLSPYKRVSSKKCAKALEWWTNNEEKWSSVRNEWETKKKKKQSLTLNSSVNGKRLYEYLLFSNEYDEKEKHKELIEMVMRLLELWNGLFLSQEWRKVNFYLPCPHWLVLGLNLVLNLLLVQTFH
jgi:hypothetical protein